MLRSVFPLAMHDAALRRGDTCLRDMLAGVLPVVHGYFIGLSIYVLVAALGYAAVELAGLPEDALLLLVVSVAPTISALVLVKRAYLR